MNEVSIIINGVRYDAVETEKKSCSDCEFLGVCADFMSDVICFAFSLKDKKFEK